MEEETQTIPVKKKIRTFFKKYFYNGQRISPGNKQAIENLPPNAPWYQRLIVSNPRVFGHLIPFAIVHLIWWTLAIKYDFFSFYPKRYRLFLVTVFGATFGGLTAAGGGPIAFTVMTLAFGIPQATARDFSLMCSCFGAICSSFGIFWMGAKVEWHYVVFSGAGSIFGVVLGFEVLDDLFPFLERKLSFAGFWFSCGIGLFLANRKKKYKTVDGLFSIRVVEALALMISGFLGGILTSIVGVDFVTYSIRLLLFRLNEKVSVPSSVVSMAVTTLSAIFWRQFMSPDGAETEAWKCLAVVIPIIFIFGPLGSYLGSHVHRHVKASVFLFFSSVTLVAALTTIPLSLECGLMVGGIIMSCCVLFLVLSFIGETYNLRLQESSIAKPAAADQSIIMSELGYNNNIEIKD